MHRNIVIAKLTTKGGNSFFVSVELMNFKLDVFDQPESYAIPSYWLDGFATTFVRAKHCSSIMSLHIHTLDAR